MKSVVLCIAIVTMVCGLPAQTLRTSLGQDFWIAFPPTEHGNTASATVFISADATTNAVVASRDRSGRPHSDVITIPAGTVRAVDFDILDYELRAYAFTGSLNGDCEQVMPQHVHITTDADVAVYAVVRDDRTSDAWLVLPTQSLGTEYRVMSYPSEYANQLFQLKKYPSQFVVVATEDNTEIEIDLNTNSSRVAAGKHRSVVMNQGDSYLLQADVSSSKPNDDLTGTRIRATKPIVVLGGHYRAQVPVLGDMASRDMLVEQMQSVDVWGKYYVVPPLKPPTKSKQSDPNDVVMVRVLTCLDSTTITVEGIATSTIPRAGGIWDLPLGKGRVIHATQPIMVAILDRTANRNTMNVDYSGDPSLIIVPPVEQYLASYRTVNIEPIVAGRPLYDQHQITVFAPLSNTRIRVDGAAVPALTRIGTSDFGYAHLDVSSGTHRSASAINPSTGSSEGFGILIYGYGPAESYGYTGGMAFEKLYQPTVWLRALDTSGAAGDKTSLVVVVDSISQRESLKLLDVHELTSSISYNSTIWVPAPEIVSSWSRQDAEHALLNFTYQFDSLSAGDTVAVLPGRMVLGSTTKDSLFLGTVRWLNSVGNPMSVAYRIKGAELTLTDVCDKNGLRLFDPLSTTGTAPTVRYYDLMGREIRERPTGPCLEVQSDTRGIRSARLLLKE